MNTIKKNHKTSLSCLVFWHFFDTYWRHELKRKNSLFQIKIGYLTRKLKYIDEKKRFFLDWYLLGKHSKLGCDIIKSFVMLLKNFAAIRTPPHGNFLYWLYLLTAVWSTCNKTNKECILKLFLAALKERQNRKQAKPLQELNKFLLKTKFETLVPSELLSCCLQQIGTWFKTF